MGNGAWGMGHGALISCCLLVVICYLLVVGC